MVKRSKSSRLMVTTGPDLAHAAAVVDHAPALHRHVARAPARQNDRAIRAHVTGDAIALIVADDHAHAADDHDHR